MATAPKCASSSVSEPGTEAVAAGILVGLPGDSRTAHSQLEGMWETIVRAQVNQIIDMRQMLCKRFGLCDFQSIDPQ